MGGPIVLIVLTSTVSVTEPMSTLRVWFFSCQSPFLTPTLILRLRLSFKCNDNVSFGILRLDIAITYLRKLDFNDEKVRQRLLRVASNLMWRCHKTHYRMCWNHLLTGINHPKKIFCPKIAFTKIYRALKLAKFLSCFTILGGGSSLMTRLPTNIGQVFRLILG